MHAPIPAVRDALHRKEQSLSSHASGGRYEYRYGVPDPMVISDLGCKNASYISGASFFLLPMIVRDIFTFEAAGYRVELSSLILPKVASIGAGRPSLNSSFVRPRLSLIETPSTFGLQAG